LAPAHGRARRIKRRIAALVVPLSRQTEKAAGASILRGARNLTCRRAWAARIRRGFPARPQAVTAKEACIAYVAFVAADGDWDTEYYVRILV